MGILTSPGTRGVPTAIQSGIHWAADNQAFTKGFNPDVFFPWLEKMKPYKSTCLFVACPDVVSNAAETTKLFETWQPKLYDFPIAFVAQDGQENLDFPPEHLWDALFIGGSTIWKMSDSAANCIQRAQALGKHIHVGRVNYLRRYNHFRQLPGSEEFTCDGTRIRYERDAAIKAWKQYMVNPKQYGLFIPRGDSGGQSDNG